MFYVYEWFVVDTNEIFYVGKGTKKRYLQTTKRNQIFNRYLKSANCSSRIIKTFETEQEAFEYENARIVELKSKKLAKANLDNGGNGGVNFAWTDEMREYKSIYNPMKRKEQRIRMSMNNPMKNKAVQNKVKRSHQIAVIIDGKEYASIIEAQKSLNVCHDTITKWCKKGITIDGKLCKYKDGEQVIFEGSRYNKGGCRKVNYNGKIYESPIDVARELGLHNSTVCVWAKKGFSPKGIVCKYIDDNAEYTYKPCQKGASQRKPIKVNGIIYSSKIEAERALGLSKGYLAPYIAGTRKNKTYICEYVNQQPSCGKSDNSTTKGSTTNE